MRSLKTPARRRNFTFYGGKARGLAQAAKCMTMAAIAYNVKTMLKFMRQWPTAALRALDYTTKPLWHLTFFMPEFRLPPATWARI
ncbi:MAG: hypothetical protein MUC38_08745 [Cyclobacteriaceae bacterium]|nr:hypothetical protein [Cyclobacteriaceae bacterium]